MTASLETFIDAARKKGYSDSDIETQLLQSGWSRADILPYLNTGDNVLVPPPPPQKQDKVKTAESMWDVFENVLLFISLYVLATSIAITLHFFVDIWVPGLEDYSLSRYDYEYNFLRGAIAALIVSLPLFTFFFYKITKRSLENPLLRKLKARKFLIYLTLVITFIIMLVNVIKIIYSFLGGNFAVNTMLHFLITVGISGIIFAYYLHQTREDRKLHE